MIQLFHVYKTFGSNNPALIDVSLTVRKGELVFITGPSGAGKTTLLKIIFCAERATSGQALVNGRNLNRIRDRELALLRRRIGVIFQDFKLLPTRSVFENVAVALEIEGLPMSSIRKKGSSNAQVSGVGKEGRLLSSSAFRWRTAKSCGCPGNNQ